MTMSNYDVTGLRAIFDMLQNHFPERWVWKLGTCSFPV